MNDLKRQEKYIEEFINSFSKRAESFENEISIIGLKNNEIKKIYKNKENKITQNQRQKASQRKKDLEDYVALNTSEIERIDFIQKDVFKRNKYEPNDESIAQKEIDLKDWTLDKLEAFAAKINDHTMRAMLYKKAGHKGYYEQKQMLIDFHALTKQTIQTKKEIMVVENKTYELQNNMEKLELENTLEQNKTEKTEALKQNEKESLTLINNYKHEIEEYIRNNAASYQFIELFQKKSKRKVNIGTKEKLLKVDKVFYEVLKEKDQNSCITYDDMKQEMMISLPVYLDFEENAILSIKFDYENCTKSELLIQDVLLTLLDDTREGDYEIAYLDFYEKAADLGVLLNLSGLPAYKPLLSVKTTKEAAIKCLNEIESYIEEVIKRIVGFDSVQSYNTQTDQKIVHKVIMINHFGVNFDSFIYEKLNTILSNLKRCGISLMLINQDDISFHLPEAISSSIQREETILTLRKKKEYFLDDKKITLQDINKQEIIERSNQLKEKLDVVLTNNLYSELLDVEFTQNSIINGLTIPFAKDENGETKYLEIGSDISTHLLLSGITGSGKSNTLHTIILGILNRYSPEDVDLWLVDYKKVEFKKYLDKRPQHLKVIGLDRSQQFSFSLLDELTKEYEKRLDVFQQYNVESLKALIEKGIKMPRVVVIIDEFHHLTQAMQENPTYAVKLENLLSESRAVGFSFVFSDQAITVGLRGFSEKSQNQVATRLAMNNNDYEMKQTLALNSKQNDLIKDSMKTLKQGDVLIKQASNESELGIHIGKFKVLRTTDQDIDTVINKVNNTYDVKKDVIVSQGQDVQTCDWKVVSKFASTLKLDHKTIPLFLGTPSTLEPCFYLPLRKEMDGNVMLISNNDELKASILLHTIKSFLRVSESKVILCADEDDDCYEYVLPYMKDIENLEIYTDYEKICNHIYEQATTSSKQNIFTIWLGFEVMSKEFKSFKANHTTQNDIKDNFTIKQDLLMGQIVEMSEQISLLASKEDGKVDIGNKEENIEMGQREEKQVYNALEDFNRYLMKGPKRGSFSMIVFDSIRIANKVKGVKLQEINHKIATKMSMEDFSNFMSNSSMAREFDDTNAIYANDGIQFEVFKPYKIES